MSRFEAVRSNINCTVCEPLVIYSLQKRSLYYIRSIYIYIYIYCWLNITCICMCDIYYMNLSFYFINVFNLAAHMNLVMRDLITISVLSISQFFSQSNNYSLLLLFSIDCNSIFNIEMGGFEQIKIHTTTWIRLCHTDLSP